MIRNRLLHASLVVAILCLIGCGHSSPVDPVSGNVPSITGAGSSPAGLPSSNYLWGIWQADYDSSINNYIFEPIRGGAFHLNVISRLQAPNPPGLSVKLNAINVTAGTVDIDITLTHPNPNTNLRGFDVRGIVMGSGNVIQTQFDPLISFTDFEGTRLTNTDGYTRWWNAVEFTTPGLFGYTRGAIGSQSFVPAATLYPYKYFADFLPPTANVTPWVNATNRGTFSTADYLKHAMKVTRNYKLKFPIVGGHPVFAFQYAIDANWALPTGGSPTPKPISDFPPEANCPEAFHIAVDASASTVFYNSDASRGGDLVLSIEVFDWGASSHLNGTDDEIQAIKVESPTLFDGVIDVPVAKTPGTQPESGIYAVTIKNTHPTGKDGQDVLVTVVSSDPTTYQPPSGGAQYPQSALLAAYAVIEAPVVGTDKIVVTNPNGGEFWANGSKHDITWQNVGNTGATVSISYNISDGADVVIDALAPNTGIYSWDPVPTVESQFVKVKITSNQYPAMFDSSNNYFAIGKAGIRVISPNGGETLPGGGSWDIRWANTTPVLNVKIELSTNGGSTFPTVIVESTPDDGLYTWDQIPVIDTTKARIRISDVLDSTSNDKSDANFTIVASGLTINVTQPNGGEKLTIGQQYEIKWISSGSLDNVRIEFSSNSGGTWPTEIIASTPNDGSYLWDPVPAAPTTHGRIRITSVEVPSVTDMSDNDFTVAEATGLGWQPVPGKELVPLSGPEPNQGDNPVDLAVFNQGANQSRGEIDTGNMGNVFFMYNDAYTDTVGDPWTFPFDMPVHKFDILQDGSVSFTTLSGQDAWNPPSINDPIHGFFSASNTVTGDTNTVYFGDGADSGPDPDQVPWSMIPDYSCGVPGGLGDASGYLLRVYSPKNGNPVAHSGSVGLIQWDSPFGLANIHGWNLKVSIQGGGYGPIDDTDPSKMALAVDDNSGLAINEKAVTIYWILDSAGQAHAIAIAMESGSNVEMATSLTGDQYGSRKPVDLEMVNAKDFGYTVTDPGFNWLAVLLDNKDGTWSVGVWEYNYLADPPAFTLIGITDAIEGTPNALDIDGIDFEIHVLSQSGADTYATVFSYSK